MMEGKLEKEPESMATVQMKAEYAASEIYSTAGSEGPPAYKMRQANSVKIAKIVALTVILSSFILGSFILASTYLQAKASCDQMHALDAMLDKELMLEALQQDSPRADSLVQGRDSAATADDLQDLDKDTDAKKSTSDDAQDTASESDSSDSSYSDSDESSDMNKIHIRLPLDLDLGDIANAVLQNNQKSRMNCVVERRRAEEFVDAPAKTVQLPFGLNLTTDPKKQKVTGERMAIICESGAEEGTANDDAEIFRQILMPMQYPIPYGAQPINPMGGPITHMPNQMPPMMHPLLQHLQPHPMMPQNNMPPHPATMMQPPRPEAPEIRFMRPQQPQPQQLQPQQPQQPHGEIRIQLQRIPIIPPQFRAMQEDRSQAGPQIQIQQFRGIPQMFRDEQPPQQQELPKPNQAGPQIQVQQLPLSLALQRAGITVDDLRNIQRMAEERFQHEIQQLVSDDGSGDADDSSEEDTNAPAQTRQANSELSNDQQPPRPDQILPMGRAGYARSMAMNPVRIPVPMMQQVNEPSQPDDSERPHFVQPRSVRSVDSVLKGESNKRVKRCACDCNC